LAAAIKIPDMMMMMMINEDGNFCIERVVRTLDVIVIDTDTLGRRKEGRKEWQESVLVDGRSTRRFEVRDSTQKKVHSF